MSKSSPDDFDSDSSDQWLSASETYRRIISVTMSRATNLAIAQRAQSGLLRAKAQMLTIGPENHPDALIPARFWWAGGHEALEQNWETGDFETWIDRKVHMRALGVRFHLGDLRKAFPEIFKTESVAATLEATPGRAGRLPAEWWDDLWIEMCRALYVGDLKPHKQADIEKAMSEWIASKGESAATSTVRNRARKLWQAISKEDEN